MTMIFEIELAKDVALKKMGVMFITMQVAITLDIR